MRALFNASLVPHPASRIPARPLPGSPRGHDTSTTATRDGHMNQDPGRGTPPHRQAHGHGMSASRAFASALALAAALAILLGWAL